MSSTTAGPARSGFTLDSAHPKPFSYVYLSSAAHSGSTLLACLLGSHPAVSTVGEFTTRRPPRLCSCGVPLADCPLFSEWMVRACAQGLQFNLGQEDISLEPRPNEGFFSDLFHHLFPWRPIDLLRDVAFAVASSRLHRAKAGVHKCVGLARILCQIESTSVFLDTTKNPYQLRFLARYGRDANLKIIALVRDGRGVMWSLMKRENFTPEAAAAAVIWNHVTQQRVLRYVRPDQVFRLKLEELWRDPNGKIGELCRFMGIDDKLSLDWTASSKRHILGNTMRLKFDGTIRRDESWRENLPASALQLFESQAGWVNRRHGYPE